MGRDSPKVTRGGRGRAGLEVSLCECQWPREPQHLGLVPQLQPGRAWEPEDTPISTGTHSERQLSLRAATDRSQARNITSLK